MLWKQKAMKIKDYILYKGYQFFNFKERHDIIKSFYACKNEDDYMCFSKHYNSIIINKLL